jgi:hypothetical protein
MCGSNVCIANPSWIPGARLQTFFMGVVRAWGLSAKRLFDARLLVSVPSLYHIRTRTTFSQCDQKNKMKHKISRKENINQGFIYDIISHRY